MRSFNREAQFKLRRSARTDQIHAEHIHEWRERCADDGSSKDNASLRDDDGLENCDEDDFCFPSARDSSESSCLLAAGKLHPQNSSRLIYSEGKTRTAGDDSCRGFEPTEMAECAKPSAAPHTTCSTTSSWFWKHDSPMVS